MATSLDMALDYSAQGWRVMPIPSGEKFPKGLPRWQVEATTSSARIIEWWGERPTAGVGIATGRESGLFVVDLDVGAGKDGVQAWKDLRAKHGDSAPSTYVVRTGSGGMHIYFAWPDGMDIRNNASGHLGAGIDIRGEGGFVVAPPSIHPNGQPYTVMTDNRPAA